MGTAENKSLMRRYFDEAWNNNRLDVLDEIVSPDYVNHNPAIPGLPPGPAGLKPIFSAFRAAFPDLQYTIENMIAEDDMVVTRWTMQGTNQGDFAGIPATQKAVRVGGIQMERVADGKIVEHWRMSDDMGLMQQLGVIPGQG